MKKLLIGTGAVIIAGMLVIATFALGVYIGRYGWTREGLALRPGGDQARPPTGIPRSPGGQEPLPGGGRQPDVIGRIRGNFEGTLALATVDGPRTVELSDRTRFETHEGKAISGDTLQEGQGVAVFGHRSADRHVLIADVVILLPPPERSPAGPPGQNQGGEGEKR